MLECYHVELSVGLALVPFSRCSLADSVLRPILIGLSKNTIFIREKTMIMTKTEFVQHRIYPYQPFWLFLQEL